MAKPKNNPARQQPTSKPQQAAPQQAAPTAATAFVPKPRMVGIALAVFAFLLFSNTLGHSYVLDDVMIGPSNVYVQKGIGGIAELFSTPYLRGYMQMPNDTYRPLSPVTLAIENQLFGINPENSHLVNVLLFAAAVGMLFFFLRQLAGNNILLATAATLLFAAHPIHTEVVANIKSRDELLCFLMAISALAAFCNYFTQGKPLMLVLGVAAYFLSLLSKESSISLVLIVPLLFFVIMPGSKPRAAALSVGTLVVAIVFLAIRQGVLSTHHATDAAFLNFMDNQLVGKDMNIRLGTASLVLGHYLRLLFIPAPLLCSYAYRTIADTGLGNPLVIACLLAYAGLLGYAVYRIAKHRHDLLAFGILFLILNLGLTSNFFLLIGAVAAERFLFFGSVGFCLVIPVVASLLLKDNGSAGEGFLSNKLWWVVLPIALVWSFMTYARNADWKDNMTLFAADIKKAPDNARLNYYFGNEMSTAYANAAQGPEKARIISESIPYLQKAVSIYPAYAEAQTTLATAFFNLQQYDSAEVHHLKALSYDSLNVLALNGLAGIYFMKQNFPRARDILVRDVAINPTNTSVIHNLGLCYLNMRMPDSCIYYGRKVLDLDPKHLETFKDMARAYTLLSRPDSAARYIQLAQGIDPGFRL